MAAGWYKWNTVAQEAMCDRVQMMRALNYMRNAALARAFFTWSSITAQIILDGTISRRGALKAAAAFKHRHLKAAFNGWHLFSREQRDTLRKMRRATFRVLHHRLSMAFFTWSS